jgi:hypothetical protein
MNIKARFFAVVIIVVFGFLMYTNWQQLQTEGKYSLKIAAFGPLGIVGGLFLLLFPRYFGKPNTTGEKMLVLLVFVIGVAAGLVNWYLMDPAFFGR